MLKNNHDKIRELAKEEPILRSVLNMVDTVIPGKIL